MSIFHDDDDGDEPHFDSQLHEMNLDPSRQTATATELERLISEGKVRLEAPAVLHRLDDQRVRQKAKDELRELYGDDFDIDHAPESLDRYEKTLTVERLRKAVLNMATAPSERHEKESNTAHVEQAIKTIDQMKTYGELAEPHLAHLADSPVMVMPVREAAVDALADVRGGHGTSHDSLRGALAAWLRPGGGD